MTDVREFVLEALQREYTFEEGVNVDEINFVDDGYMDSLGLVQFVAEIEDEFEIEFTEEEMETDEFRTVGTLIKMIENKIQN